MNKDVRILVEGSRGKSGIVKSLTELLYNRGEDVVGKISGKETVVFRDGQEIAVKREDGKRFLLDQENKKIMNDYKDVRFKIFENQALSCYTMKVVHLIVKPHILVIPNIRFEHQDRLGENMVEIAQSFAFNFKGVRKVITTENKKVVLDVFVDYCDKFGVELIVVDSSNESIPSMSFIDLIDRVLNEVGVRGLFKEEEDGLRVVVKNAMCIKHSKGQGVDYFNGAKVNDIESSTMVFEYLKRTNRSRRFVFLCYLRGDRPERTESFFPFFDAIYDDCAVERVYFTGSGLKHIKDNDKAIKNKYLSKEEVISYCKKRGLVLFTAVNGVNDFMRELEISLERK